MSGRKLLVALALWSGLSGQTATAEALLLAPALSASEAPPIAAQATLESSLEAALANPAATELQPLPPPTFDDSLLLTQAAGPAGTLLLPRTPVRTVSSPARPATRAGASLALASIPYMIGDTSAGACTTFAGFILEADIAHPTLACSRLNVAENNSALPVDRWYVSYRHFHNATPLRFFQFQRDANLDTFVLGGEHTFLDGACSAEVRLPIEGRVSSDLSIIDNVPFDGQFDGWDGVRRTELGNMSGIFKMIAYEQPDFLLSTGLAVTMPTAQDFYFHADVTDSIFYNFPNLPPITALRNATVDLYASNESVYLAPFLAWLWTPAPKWYHQGFLQVETAANPSTVVVHAFGQNRFFVPNFPPADLTAFVPPPGSAKLHPQTLMRLNLGVGRVLKDDPSADWVQQLTSIFEVHYTTTLNDAKFTTIQAVNFLPPELGGGVLPENIFVGNRFNRSDIVNVATGLQASVGRFIVSNGVVAPVRRSPDRGFDFEYNLQVQRPF